MGNLTLHDGIQVSGLRGRIQRAPRGQTGDAIHPSPNSWEDVTEGGKRLRLNLTSYHDHPVPGPEPPVAPGRVLDDVVDVAAVVAAFGEGEAQAAFLRLHQGGPELGFLTTKGSVEKLHPFRSRTSIFLTPYRAEVIHFLSVTGKGEVQGQRQRRRQGVRARGGGGRNPWHGG